MEIIFCIAVVFICIFIWFQISYSPLKSEFEREYKLLSQKAYLHNKLFSTEQLSAKPALLQKFIHYCGLHNKPMMTHSVTEHLNADFLLKDDSPMIKIQYKQANFAAICERLAFIDTRMFGIIPFQGLDENVDGKGCMKGVIAKLFTVFNVKGHEMDLAALVTVLAEGVVCPSFLMHDDIRWKELDSTHLQAELTQYGMTVSGVFEFNEEGAIIGFYTKDRYQENNGAMTRRDWKIECGGYEEIDGIKCPTMLKALWLYANREEVYFDCSNVTVHFEYAKA